MSAWLALLPWLESQPVEHESVVKPRGWGVVQRRDAGQDKGGTGPGLEGRVQALRTESEFYAHQGTFCRHRSRTYTQRDGQPVDIGGTTVSDVEGLYVYRVLQLREGGFQLDLFREQAVQEDGRNAVRRETALSCHSATLPLLMVQRDVMVHVQDTTTHRILWLSLPQATPTAR